MAIERLRNKVGLRQNKIRKWNQIPQGIDGATEKFFFPWMSKCQDQHKFPLLFLSWMHKPKKYCNSVHVLSNNIMRHATFSMIYNFYFFFLSTFPTFFSSLLFSFVAHPYTILKGPRHHGYMVGTCMVEWGERFSVFLEFHLNIYESEPPFCSSCGWYGWQSW